MNRNDNYLKLLAPPKTQAEFLMKTAPIAAYRQRILFDAPALKINKNDNIGGNNDSSVKQNIRIDELIDGQQQYNRGQYPHNPLHRITDTLFIAKGKDNQHKQLKPHNPISAINKRTPSVNPVSIKVK